MFSLPSFFGLMFLTKPVGTCCLHCVLQSLEILSVQKIDYKIKREVSKDPFPWGFFLKKIES